MSSTTPVEFPPPQGPDAARTVTRERPRMRPTENPRAAAGASEAPQTPTDAPESGRQRPDGSQDPGTPTTAADGRVEPPDACPSCGCRHLLVARRRWPWRQQQTWRCYGCFAVVHATTPPDDPKDSA